MCDWILENHLVGAEKKMYFNNLMYCYSPALETTRVDFSTKMERQFCAKTKRHQNSPELLLLKFLPLTYHHSHFLAATLDFTSFFTITFLGAALFFYSLAVLD